MNFIINKKFLIFDLDGTLIDSSSVIESLWTEWAIANKIEVQEILKISHGRRAIDTMENFVGKRNDLEDMASEFIRKEIQKTEGIVALPGAINFLKKLPLDRWAIVTSCVKELAMARMNAAGIPIPKVLVTADMVDAGKPDPQGFLLAAKKLSASPNDCIAFEDAVSGVDAAISAGMMTILVNSTVCHGDVIYRMVNYNNLNQEIVEEGILIYSSDY